MLRVIARRAGTIRAVIRTKLRDALALTAAGSMPVAALVMSLGMSLGVALTVAGCGDSATEPTTDECTPLVFPALQDGSWWEYERTEWDEGAPDHVFAVTTEVISVDTLAAGVSYHLLDDLDKGESWLYLTGCELRRYDTPLVQARDYEVILHTPFAAEEHWQYTSASYGGHALQAKIVSADESVTVPAGTFTGCIHVQVDPYYDTWFSPAHGIVAAEYHDASGVRGWRDVLVDHVIGGKVRSRAKG